MIRKSLFHFFEDSRELFYSPTISKGIKWVALLFALFGILGASIGIPFSGDNAYYIMLIVSTFFLIFKGGLKISEPFIAFYSVILINIILVDIPPFFKPMQRALLFFFLTMVCSSALQTDTAIRFRSYLFKYTIYGMIIIGVGSFFCFFLGINMMSTRTVVYGNDDVYITHGGLFSGLACHSMMLGPIAMVSALTFYFLYQKKSRNIYLVLFFISTMSVILSASRATLLSLILAIIYNLIFGEMKIQIKTKIIRIITISAILTIPISGVVFTGIVNKQKMRESQSKGLNSRQDKFDYRIDEFKSSPIFGVGFCAIDINGGDRYSVAEGRIEPGTSHLSVVSMLGTLGLIAYIVILYNGYANTKMVRNIHSRYVFTCFIAFFVHAWFEGYILSGGGFLALAYWLILGQCIDCPRVWQLVKPRVKKTIDSPPPSLADNIQKQLIQ